MMPKHWLWKFCIRVTDIGSKIFRKNCKVTRNFMNCLNCAPFPRKWEQTCFSDSYHFWSHQRWKRVTEIWPLRKRQTMVEENELRLLSFARHPFHFPTFANSALSRFEIGSRNSTFWIDEKFEVSSSLILIWRSHLQNEATGKASNFTLIYKT